MDNKPDENGENQKNYDYQPNPDLQNSKNEKKKKIAIIVLVVGLVVLLPLILIGSCLFLLSGGFGSVA